MATGKILMTQLDCVAYCIMSLECFGTFTKITPFRKLILWKLILSIQLDLNVFISGFQIKWRGEEVIKLKKQRAKEKLREGIKEKIRQIWRVKIDRNGHCNIV